MDRVVDLLSVDRDLFRSFHSQSDFVAADFDHHDGDVIANPDDLVLLPAEYQHDSTPIESLNDRAGKRELEQGNQRYSKMTSSTFQRLYQRAMQREHLIIDDVEQFWKAGLVTRFPEGVRMAKAFRRFYREYIDDLEEVVLRRQMPVRIPLRGIPCPVCGSTECEGGDLSLVLGPSGVEALKAMLAGKMPPHDIPPTAL